MNLAIVVTGVENAAVLLPGNGHALRGSARLPLAEDLEGWLDEVDLGPGLDVPNADALVGGSASPRLSWAGTDAVDWCHCGEGEHLGAVLKLPHAELPVGATGDDPLAVWAEGDGGAAALVTLEGLEEIDLLADLPDLDLTVPETDGDEEFGLGLILGVAGHAGAPVLGWEAGLADTDGVPDLHGLVTGAGDDTPVARREAGGEDILLVVEEDLLGGALLEVPETDGLVPGAGQEVGVITGERDTTDEVVVANEPGELNTPGLLGLRKLPNEGAVVPGTGDEVLGVLADDERGDSHVVSLEDSTVNEPLGD